MKLHLAVSAVLSILSTRVECFVSSGGNALARSVRSAGMAANSAFVQPISRWAQDLISLQLLVQQDSEQHYRNNTAVRVRVVILLKELCTPACCFHKYERPHRFHE